MPTSNTLKQYLNCYKTLLPKDQIKKFCTMISPHLIKNQYFDSLNKMGDYLTKVMPQQKLKDLVKLKNEIVREPKEQCLPIIGKQFLNTDQDDIQEMLEDNDTVCYANIGGDKREVFLRDEKSQNAYQLLVPENEYDAFHENMDSNLLLHVLNVECGLSIHIGHSEL